jgi:transcriptional regulator with XRE-family HTH domain
MNRNLFLVRGNICGERVKLGRALQKPMMKQEDLAREINLLGMDITPVMISKIENNKRHVCDAELVMLAKALHVSMDWLCGLTDESGLKI